MARLRLELDQRTFDALARVAGTQLRPIPWQAEVMLQQALGVRTNEPSIDNRTGDDAMLDEPDAAVQTSEVV